MALTREDLDQIRAIVTEIVTATVNASEGRLIARQDAMAADFMSQLSATEARVIARQDAIAEDLRGRQERAIDVINGEISGLRSELSGRIDILNKRFDNMLNLALSTESKVIYLIRSVDEALSFKEQAAARLEAQQKAFDQLMARIKRIEDDLRPGQQ